MPLTIQPLNPDGEPEGSPFELEGTLTINYPGPLWYEQPYFREGFSTEIQGGDAMRWTPPADGTVRPCPA